MTYLDVAETLVQLNSASLEYRDELPGFLFEVEREVMDEWYSISRGSWAWADYGGF